MTVAISIGSFKHVDFVALNLSRCRVLYPDSPIVVSDDRSSRSDDIRALADRFDAAYTCGIAPRGHFAGDVQTGINALSLAQQEGCDIALKLSMRLVPVTEKFREYIEKPFIEKPWCNIVIPGPLRKSQIPNPIAHFYCGFGILSDVYAIRAGSISAQDFKAEYESMFYKGRYASDNVVEVFLGRLLAKRFSGASFVSDDLANHKPRESMAFLRKAQCTSLTYQQVAALDGLSGDYDTREHAQISGKDYLSRPVV